MSHKISYDDLINESKEIKSMANDKLESLAKGLSEILFCIIGDRYNARLGINNAIEVMTYSKEKDRFVKDKSFYFKYSDDIGFYVVDSKEHINLNDINGEEFYKRIKQISDWISICLPSYLKKSLDSAKKRVNSMMKSFNKLVNTLNDLEKKD